MSAIDLIEPTEPVSQQWLEKQLSEAQEQLEKRVKKIDGNDKNDFDDDDDSYGAEEHVGTPMDQLHELNDKVEALALAQEATQWAQSAQSENSEEDIFKDAKNVVDLAKILCRHDSDSSLYQNLFEREYQPLHSYVRAHLVLQLRHILLQAKYPSAEGCGILLEQVNAGPCPLTQCCEWLTRLQATNFQLIQHTHKTSVSAGSSPWSMGETCLVLVEFFRPIVERVRYHFVDSSSGRVTSNKIDRLPEWLLTYLQEHVLEGKSTTTSSSSPWELLTLGCAPYVTEEMPTLFLNELVGVVQFVLGSERNFFRDPKVSGPNSNPMLLCNGIEKLLEFDDTLRNLLPMGQADRLLRCMDVFVAGDEELLSWWLAREKEMVFSTLFDNLQEELEQAEAAKSTKFAALVKTRISPRAELFCALIRSVQVKASVFSFSGPYLNAVAVPLCMKFLDAVHESATELRKVLASPTTALGSGSSMPALTYNLEDWMAVINGTLLAAAILTRENPWAQKSMAPSVNSSVNDLARFGRSLDQLQNVLVEEFAATFVETFLMERMKLAGYLMRTAHFLSHPLNEEDDDDMPGTGGPDISQDLRPCWNALSIFLKLCSESDEDEMTEAEGRNFAIQFAPRVMREKVMPRLADKFLEVALDLHGLTPDILLEGAQIFESDVNEIFDGFASSLPQEQDSASFAIVFRLLDIAQLMAIPTKQLCDLQSALMGLVGGP